MTAKETSYIPALDGLRAICALMVLAFHSEGRYFPGGFLGVDAFFAISGFLITRNIVSEYQEQGRVSLARFYVRRATRLLPALGVALLLAYLLWPKGEAPYGAAARSALLYYANWKHLIDGPASLGILVHTWSLSIEEQFYLLWPVLLVVLLRRAPSTKGAARWTGGLVLVLVSTRAIAEGLGWRIAGYASTAARIDELLVGAVFALWPSRSAGTHRGTLGWVSMAGMTLLLVPGALVRWELRWLNFGGYTLVAILTGVIVRWLSTECRSKLSTLLAWRPLVEIGKRSYGVYVGLQKLGTLAA